MDPNDPNVLLRTANELFEQGRNDEAEVLTKRCVALDPADAWCQLLLGTIYMRIQRPDDAAKHYRILLKLTPNHMIKPDVMKMVKDYVSDYDRRSRGARRSRK